MLKKTVNLVVILFLCLFLSGCFGSRETNKIAFALAMGIDKGIKDKIMVTFQIANPQNISGSSRGNGDGQNKSFIVVSVEGPSVLTCMQMANTAVSREISLMHCKAIIYGEDIAKEDVMKYLKTQIPFRDIRSNTDILVAAGTAKDYINKVDPNLEISPAKYYEAVERMSQYNAFTPRSLLKDFYGAIKSSSEEPVAALVAVKNDVEKTLESGSPSIPSGRNDDYHTSEVSPSGDLQTDYIGTAIFKGNKMVGEINGHETRSLVMLRGEYNYSYYTVKDLKNPGKSVEMIIKQGRHPDINVNVKNKTIKETIYLEGELVAGGNYENSHMKKAFEKYFSARVKENCDSLLDKLQNTYATDSVGYGNYAKLNYLTYDDWIKSDWLNNFPDYKIDITIKTIIRRSGILGQAPTSPTKPR